MRPTLLLLSLALATHVSGQELKSLQITTTESSTWEVRPQQVDTAAEANSQRLVFSSDKVETTFRRWGTCFNELDWWALQLLPQSAQDEFFHRLFAPDGDLRFTLGRIPMGASDYAGPENFYTELFHQREEGIDLEGSWYSADEMPSGEQDLTMEYFTLERDRVAIMPYIKRAQQETDSLIFWCSPWSPPQWMKLSEHYSNRAGYGNGLDTTYPRYTTQFKMEDDILQAYAKYFSLFIDGYGEEGIPIQGCCYQNEAYTVNYYPNTSWSAEDAGRFNADYLVPYLREHNPGVKIWLGTLNTADVDNIETILNYTSTATGWEGKRLSEMLDGAAFQWEGRDAIATIRADYPNLEMVQSESECGSGTFDWAAGVHTFELIHHYLNNGCVDYTNWNAILGGNGRGPFMNWWQNALVHIDQTLPSANGSCTATYTPEFYAYKHYSHFMPEGTRVLQKPADKDLLLVAQRPDGTYIAVVGNEASTERQLQLEIDGTALDIAMPANSMNTFILGPAATIDSLAVAEGMAADATPYEPTSTHEVYIDDDEEYYLYNVNEGRYLDAGGRYGTRPVLSSVGGQYHLVYGDAGDIYYLSTPYGSGTYLGYLEVGTDLSLDQKYFLDSSTSKEALTFYPTDEEDTYSIGIYGTYLGFKSSLSIGSLNDGELGYVDEPEAWRLVTAEERWAEARQATEEQPADVTFGVLGNPHFNRLNGGDDAWTPAPTVDGLTTDPYREYLGQYSGSDFSGATLQLTRLPAGTYTISLTAFARGASTSLTLQSGDETASALLPAHTDGDQPTTAADAVMSLGTGEYATTSATLTVRDGKLAVSLTPAEPPTSDYWLCFDDLQVTYYPYASASQMSMDYLDSLSTAIARSQTLLEQTADSTGKGAFQSAIETAQRIYNDQPDWYSSQQAIFDLEDAIEQFASAQASIAVVQQMGENGDDASYLLPKITEWEVDASSVEYFETTDENWDAISASSIGLVKIYTGTATTMLEGMPAGSYKMVAAVRGTRNNRMSAQLTGGDASTLILSGWSLDECGTDPIINKYGVQMPAPNGNENYNSGTYCKGWQWIAAEGTLAEAGPLTITFTAQRGEGQVSNVYLYYLSNNQVVSMQEDETLLNEGKTVTVDLSVSSPNTIVQSEEPIVTASGDYMPNCLSQGRILNLQWWDAYAINVPTEAVAEDVSLARDLTANQWQTLCLPFSMPVPDGLEARQLTGDQVSGDTLTLQFSTAENIEAGKPYIVTSESDLEKITVQNVTLCGDLQTVSSSHATMQGTFAPDTIPQGAYYFSEGALSCADTDQETTPATYAWIEMTEEAQALHVQWEDISTSVGSVTVSPSNAAVYSLSGLCISQPAQRGIYIREGKKQILK